MSALQQVAKRSLGAGIAAMLLAGCAGMSSGSKSSVSLSGSQEVPPVSTGAAGNGSIAVAADRSVSGSVMTSGVAGTAAHIHQAPMGQNGPVIIPLTKSSDNTWSVPAGTKLTDAQYDAYRAGNLYVNVHSEANKGGEIRGQIRP
jgi:CHRD domain-containing protein